MILAFHVIFSCYGYWLPNDPRGSWSDWVRSWEILRFGCAKKTDARHSVAHAPHDRQKRQDAKKALRHPPVKFNGVQARAVARGFAHACRESGYVVLACAIMPDHVHLVIARNPDRTIEQMTGHIKAFATRQLRGEGVHPLAEFAKNGEVPTPWAHGKGWTRYLNSRDDILRSIRYVDENPMKEGLRAQKWKFVTEFV